MNRDFSKTTTADAILGMLTMDSMSGYDLKQRIERSIGNFWNESFGQIYPALKQLESDGLVSVEAEGKTGRKVYSITDAGRDYLERWLEVAPRQRVPRNELLLKLFFGRLAAPGVLRAHVLETRARYTADLERYEGYAGVFRTKYAGNAGVPYWSTALRFGLAEARMIVDWCDETLATLDAIDSEEQTQPAGSPADHREPAGGTSAAAPRI